ncbi:MULTISPECIES: hypothetical protein [Paenibacillaceae]|uniref:hypothetical protein n=1 Tax=Paenibacillaceae TaxID=186822 RepID=UPI00046941C8|nr:MULTISPECIES: hypothetical protein [Paenibacillaceae]GIP20870.1 hypothetical protein J22TS3_11450 [Paenibacillus sp. J22TS3]
MLLPIIMLLLCLVGGGAVFFYLNMSNRKKKATSDTKQQTAHEFINVKDIRGHYLYTLDGLVLCFLKVFPVSIDLLSKSEKQHFINMLTAELSTVQYPFKFIAVSRPVDISPVISQLTSLLNTDDPKQKELLKHEILEMNTFALSGEVVERQFYLSVWNRLEPDGERESLQRIKSLAQHFEDCQVQTQILKQQDIVRLCNLVHNPGYTHLETTDQDAVIPFLTEGGLLHGR